MNISTNSSAPTIPQLRLLHHLFPKQYIHPDEDHECYIMGNICNGETKEENI
jgi:hypothetical protein